MKKLIPFTLLGLVSIGAQAQLVIDETDFPTAGTALTFGSDVDVTNLTLNLGTASSTPQTWDFSTLETDSLVETAFYVPGTVMGGSDFPTADLAVDQFGGYAFAEVTTNDVQILGLATDFGVPCLVCQFHFLRQSQLRIRWTIFTFPSSVGTSYD
jgi:hypothetical protein